MKTINPSILVLLSALVSGVAGANGLSNTSADYGTEVAAPAARTIVITPSTKYVNVSNGEVVEFSINGKTLRWNFNTFQQETAFDLSKIAPQAQAGNVTVYVTPNPLYRG
jgi:hypothetical protein